jgi:hypothetical protein
MKYNTKKLAFIDLSNPKNIVLSEYAQKLLQTDKYNNIYLCANDISDKKIEGNVIMICSSNKDEKLVDGDELGLVPLLPLSDNKLNSFLYNEFLYSTYSNCTFLFINEVEITDSGVKCSLGLDPKEISINHNELYNHLNELNDNTLSDEKLKKLLNNVN